MNIDALHTELKDIERTIRANQLEPSVCAHINWCGDEIDITIRAAEKYDVNGFWKTEKSFCGNIDDAEALLSGARSFARALPSAEDRTIELLIQKLTKLASELPKGSTDIAQAAWAEIHAMMIGKAERLAKGALPGPVRIASITA